MQGRPTTSAADLRDRLRAAAIGGTWCDVQPHRSDVPAATVADLLTRRAAGSDPLRAVRLRGARIVGELNLEGVDLPCALHLDDCELSDDVHLELATAPAVALTRCTLPLLSASQLVTRGDVDLTDSVASGGVDLVAASVGGTLRLCGASLSSPGADGRALRGSGLKVAHHLHCRADRRGRFTAEETVDLSGATIGGDLDLDGAILRSPTGVALYGDGLCVGGSMLCRKYAGDRFEAHGEIRLLSAHVDQLEFGGACLTAGPRGAISGDRLSVKRDASFNVVEDQRFEAEASISLRAATIGGQLSFKGASLRSPSGPVLDADGLRIGENAYFEPDGDLRFEAGGEVRLLGAKVGGQMSFNGAALSGVLNGEGIAVAHDLFFQTTGEHSFEAAAEVRLLGARVTGQLGFNGAFLEDPLFAVHLEGATCESLWLRFARRPPGIVVLDTVAAKGIYDRSFGSGRDEWPRTILLGATYEALRAQPPVDVRARLRWLEGDPGGYAPHAYEQLAAMYRRSGHDDDARRVGIEKEKRRRSTLGPRGTLWSLFLGATVGHGYRPSQAVAWLAGLLAAGTVLFGFVYDHGQKGADLTAAKADPAPFQPLIFTLDLLVPVISLGQRISWNAHGSAQWVALFLTVIGWLLTAALLGGIAARRR